MTVPCACPGCGTVLTGATSIGSDNVPKHGDVTVCVYCAALLHFVGVGELVTLERMNLQQISALDQETQSTLLRAVRAIEFTMKDQK